MRRGLFLLVPLFAACAYGEIRFTATDCPVSFEGIVTFHRQSDSYYFLVDDAGVAWRVNESRGRTTPEMGDRVKVEGVFPKSAAMPRVEKAVSVKIGTGTPPAAREMSVEDFYALDPDGEVGRRDWYGRVVAVAGPILDVNRRETFTQVLIGTKKHPILVPIPINWSEPLPKGLALGSVIRVRGVGVYTVLPTSYRGVVTGVENFNVLPARIEDVRIVSVAPFWTFARVLLLLGAFVVVMCVVVGILLRAKARDAIEADAVRRERLRLTSELHDNFQQLLAGCMFRLGAAMGKVGKDDEAARNQLELLRNSLNHTQASLRAALWGLTEEAEGPAALTELFRYVAGRMPQWENVVHFTIRGRERSVARPCSGALLLILQEAIGNALRHGGATRVDVVVDFTDDALLVGVQDNGIGFDVNQSADVGHLGLDTMRKHAEGLGGMLTLASVPGEGTTVSVRIPL